MRSRASSSRGSRAQHLRSSSGQATVEVVAIMPLLLLGGAAAFEFLAAGAAHELAGHAAEAAAVALVQGGDPRDAARRAVPGWAGDRMRVEIAGSRVLIHLAPPAPSRGLADLLEAEARADAGEGKQ